VWVCSRSIGLCEVSARSLRRAHAVHPIAAVQSEYSLWTRDPEAHVLPACREFGVGFVPFSPIGRAVLTGTIDRNAQFESGSDMRSTMPRFRGENLKSNLALVEELKQIAAERDLAPGQLALAWLLGRDDFVVPIPGTKRRRYLEQNAGAAEITLDRISWTRSSRPRRSPASVTAPPGCDPRTRTTDRGRRPLRSAGVPRTGRWIDKRQAIDKPRATKTPVRARRNARRGRVRFPPPPPNVGVGDEIAAPRPSLGRIGGEIGPPSFATENNAAGGAFEARNPRSPARKRTGLPAKTPAKRPDFPDDSRSG